MMYRTMSFEKPPERWRVLLEQAITCAGKGGQLAVAQALGVSRTYVSRVMSTGKSGLKEVSERFIARVIACYEKPVYIDCPATQRSQLQSECDKANQPAPTHHPIAVQIWRKCQICPKKPPGEKS